MDSRDIDFNKVTHAIHGGTLAIFYIKSRQWHRTAHNVFYNGEVIIQDDNYLYYPSPTIDIFEPEVVEYIPMITDHPKGVTVLGFRITDFFDYEIKMGWRSKEDYMEWRLSV